MASDDTSAPRGLRLPTPPLWLFGLLEGIAAVLVTALLIAVPVFGLAVAQGFTLEGLGSANLDMDASATTALAAQVWLVVHAAPLELVDAPEAGFFHLVPLGLTLIPFLLSVRAGRRLAQGAYPDQLWQGLVGYILIFGVAAGLIAPYAQTPLVSASVLWAVVAAVLVSAVGILGGCYAEARSATRMIGVDLEAKIEELSQRLKWAGAYVWAVLKGGAVAATAAVGLAALLTAGQLAVHWMDIANTHQQLDTGWGGTLGLTLLHLALLPNLVLWALAYSTGAGFAVGTGTVVSPFAVELGPVPAVPVLSALPQTAYEYSFAVLALPVAAGFLAGWWQMREGENHVDDWFALRVPWRPASLTLSTLTLGVLTGAVAAVLLVLPLWLSHISLGLGRMTDLGPHALYAAGLLGAWVALGTVLGYLITTGVKTLVRAKPSPAAPAARPARRRRHRAGEEASSEETSDEEDQAQSEPERKDSSPSSYSR
ncbi:cell division protein PerM [Nesterenkonia flava]|uniref:DUF6350 family protein n=1 Tax=Nesterenkonia flava TaxID=469799 RepID=A0ABU1FVR2_9MICC|nr:DUF6350 family protein [Nesterenkonia flava]MDR5712756.1 DUF6350 family protein [Nesterenkonia flava]